MQYVGKLLVASPNQKDPFWNKTVIWLYECSQENYAGLIINKPSPKNCGELAHHHNIHWDTKVPLYIGGPANPSALILMHSQGWATPNTQTVGDVCLSSHGSMLNRLAEGDQPDNWRLVLGHCGWAPGQLEREIMRRDGWLHTDFDPDILWDIRRPEVVWHQVLDRATHEAVDRLFEI